MKITLLALTLFLSLNGPLITGIVLILCPLVILSLWHTGFRKEQEISIVNKLVASFRKIPGFMLLSFVLFCFLSLYSLFIARNNSMNLSEYFIPMAARYQRIPGGIISILTNKPGLGLLLIMNILNLVIIRFNKDQAGKKVLKLAGWLGLFSLLYILLLPLGGYREYRHDIVRYDTILPVTMGMIMFYGFSTLQIFDILVRQRKNGYLALTAVILIFYTISDLPGTGANACERKALMQIARSDQPVVLLPKDCNVFSWRLIDDPDDTRLKAALLKHWRVTNEARLFYQVEK
jgi:hypothetical protein